MQNALLAGGILLVAIVLIGGGGLIASLALYRSAGSPIFWFNLSQLIWKELKPRLLKAAYDFVARNAPAVEKAMVACIKSGGVWDNFKKKCKQ